MRARGFTLIEMVMVIVVGAIIAATLSVFMRPAMDSYLATRSRASLKDQMDTALQPMLRDIRSAVPNSIRSPGAQCFELVPASAGGRARLGPAIDHDASPGCAPSTTCAAPLDTSQPITAFDVLSTLSATPVAGDWVVAGNQSPSDVYGGVNRVALTSISVPDASFGTLRLGFAGKQFPPGYDSGRFQVVPDRQKAVFYVCAGADGTLDAGGNGKGTLYRLMNYGFNAGYPAACPATAGADVMATQVRSCSFIYDPNQGATQQNGFVWLELELSRNNETAHLAIGAHVSNVP
jgi:MSHA biogenesis protein MshO